MKIFLLHYSSPPIVGGVESVLAHHARLMASAGHEVTILAGRGETFDERIKVHILPRLDSRHPDVMNVKALLDDGKYIPAFDLLRDQIKEELADALSKCEILIAHNIASLPKNLALTAALHELYKKSGFPHLVLWHHDLAWTAPRYRKELHDGFPWNLLKTNWDGTTQIVVSELRRKELAGLLNISKEKLIVIPNGVDINAFFKFETQTIELIEQLNLLDADPLFLLPVRLTPRKNIELALQVMAGLRRDFQKAMLLVTGPEGPHNPNNKAYKQRLLALRDELKLRDSVHFLAEMIPEFIPDAVIADFYRIADALLLPSHEEGFGIPVIEAAFSKIPVFCSDLPVLREVGGTDASYFNVNTKPSVITSLIIERLNNERTSLGARRVKHGYTWDQIYSIHIAQLLQDS